MALKLVPNMKTKRPLVSTIVDKYCNNCIGIRHNEPQKSWTDSNKTDHSPKNSRADAGKFITM
jgi:hypothetical protein